MGECKVAPDKKHNWRPTEANACYTTGGVFYATKGKLTCSFCLTEQKVYDIPEAEQAPALRELGHMHAGSFRAGEADVITKMPRPVNEAFALFTLEWYRVDVTRILPYGLGPVLRSAGTWEDRAPGDMWVRVTTDGRVESAEVGQVYTVVAGQIARIPLDPRLA